MPRLSRKSPPTQVNDARERTLRTAYELFCENGVKAVGIDRIVAEAGVAKMTLYRNFRSKDELVLAALERREELWTHAWLQREVEQAAPPGRDRLLAIFDALDAWFRRENFEGCLFINTLLESHGAEGAVGTAAARGLANVRVLVARWLEEAGVRDSDAVAGELQTLMSGAIIHASAGDLDAARRARASAELILAREGLGP